MAGEKVIITQTSFMIVSNKGRFAVSGLGTKRPVKQSSFQV
jgi:hypothetical protein